MTRYLFYTLIIFTVSSMSLIAQTIHFKDFEDGIGNWSVSNGLWEVGVPLVGPTTAHSGQNCAGTDLDANYPGYANTSLRSPYILLPNITEGEHIKLKFWYWFNIFESWYFGTDQSWIEISSNGHPWQIIAGPISGWSPVWSQGYVDLTAYADSAVRIGFLFTSNSSYESDGWFIDDVSIEVGSPIINNPEDFESGIGDWSSDNGLWELGIPTVGPSSAHSGQNCFGTVLNGNYTTDANTRLISPYLTLPIISSDDHIKFKFWYWFNIFKSNAYGTDESWIQISVNGGNWQPLAGPISGWSAVWSNGYVDLSAFAGSTVRMAFYFTSDTDYPSEGMYIDDISIEVSPPIINNPEDFETGIGDWSSDNGIWELGTPTVGPSSAHSGQNCFGTILNGNYTSYDDTRLISPYITLIPEQGNFIELYFWHWFRISQSVYYGNDNGYIQISVNNGPWQTLAGPITGYSPVWTQGYVDLSAYINSTVRIAFYLHSNNTYEDNGWYIDDVRMEGMITGVDAIKAPIEYILNQNYPNPFNPSTKIQFSIPQEVQVNLNVFNVLGERVKELKNEMMKPGYYEVEFNASSLASGIYLYRIKAGDFVEMKKMIFLK